MVPFASYSSRGQSKPRLIFSRIKGPNDANYKEVHKVITLPAAKLISYREAISSREDALCFFFF